MDMEFQDGISKERYFAIGRAVLIYAVLIGICLYKNASGILTIVGAIATVWLICYCAGTTETKENARTKRLYLSLIHI